MEDLPTSVFPKVIRRMWSACWRVSPMMAIEDGRHLVFITMHFNFEANSKVSMLGAFALDLHAYANDLMGYRNSKDGSSQEAKPELPDDDIEARAGTKGP